MPDPILIATDQGVTISKLENGGLVLVQLALEGVDVTSIVRVNGAILAGTRAGIHRSTDGGITWGTADEGLSIPHVRWLSAHPDRPGFAFAGTEPAGIFVSTDSGQTWTARPEVEALRDTHGWWLPYSPEAGCVRGFAFHGDRGYAAVEVGGLLRTDDQGATWDLARGSSGDPQFIEPAPGHIHADVHSVEVHPTSPDLVFAATNAGLYRSRDGGVTWLRINPDGYTRAVRLDPDDPDHIISGPAASVGRGGRIVESRDGGETWQPHTNGLDAPWRKTMVERFCQASADHLLAVLDDGQVRILDFRTGIWQTTFENEGEVRAIAA